MKKVLHRSFKPAKCKTSLQMAASRLKILKNKKDAQIKQLRRELAQLLESGQTQTAKIRVEHVVREEKTVAAYELVGIYCELLVARIGVIESQKICPTDLKESVASVLYASQRLSDVPELSDIVKHFSAKYGKDFASAAIGLQPSSGVSRLLVDKLSVKAPDAQTKIKILTEIAAEHNVTWEAESLIESDPKETTSLSGASSSQSASGINVDSSKLPNNEPPNFQVPATVDVQHGSSERNHVPQNSYPSHTHGTTSSDVKIGKTNTDHYHPDSRNSEARTDGREYRHQKPSNSDSSSWETKFIDSTSAARAAAESAERASFAARAAAELSRKERMMMQESTQSQNSPSSNNLRNNPPHRHSNSNMQTGGFVEEKMLRTSTRQDKSPKAEPSKNTDHEPSENSSWRRSYSRENSPETKPNNSCATLSTEKQPDINVSCSEDVEFRKQSSRGSSRSHSSNYSDHDVIASHYVDSSSILEENIFATEDKHQSQSTFEDTDSHFHGPDAVAQTFEDSDSHFHGPGAVSQTFEDSDSHFHGPDVVSQTFDDYSSLYDRPQFDTEDVYLDESGPGLGFSFLGSKTPEPIETNSWGYTGDKSPGKHSSISQVFYEKPESSLVFDDLPESPPAPLHEPELSAKFDDLPASPPAPLHEPELSAKFDDYNPDSETEEEDQRNKGDISGVVEEKPKLMTNHSSVSEAPDDLGRYFFPSDTEDQGEDSRTREESDVETPTAGTRIEPLASEFKNEDTLSPYRKSLPREEKSVKEHIRTDVYTQKASRTDKRSSSIPPDSSSSDDEPEIEFPGKASSRNQDSRTRLSHHVSHGNSEEEIKTLASTKSQDSRTRPLHRVSHGDSEEEIKDQASTRNQDSRTRPSRHVSHGNSEEEIKNQAFTRNQERSHKRPEVKTNPINPVSASYLLSPSSDEEDEKETRRRVETKPVHTRLSRRTKGQEKSSSPVTAKTSKTSYDQESSPKLSPQVKPLAKQEPSASSSSYPKTITSSAATAKTSTTSYDQESPPKLSHLVKSLAKQEPSASYPKTVTSKGSYDQESPPKLTPLVKSQTKQEPSASSSSYPKPVTSKASYDQDSPPKPSPLVKPQAKQEPPASSSSYSKNVTSKGSYGQESPPKLRPLVKPQAKQEPSAEPETPAKERASHVHPKLPDYDDLFAKLGGNRR